jgi:hypothetical protein
MDVNLKIGVYRRLDNRFEGLSDDSPRALELHNRRKEALHAVLDNESAIHIEDWGNTDDTQPHEFVEIILGVAATATFKYAVVPGVKWLGKKLADKAIDTVLSELVKAVVAKLRPKQKSKDLLDFIITLPDGTQIAVDPPDRYATITINFAYGAVQSLEYLKSNNQNAG